MAAIELASTEGFTRSAADVSLRRLAHYSLSPVMKSAFEQVYGPPFLARLLFAEIGTSAGEDLFLRVDYDGTIAANGNSPAQARQGFAVLGGTGTSAELMESFLKKEHVSDAPFETAIQVALDAWSVGRMATGENGIKELPERAAIDKHRQEQLADSGIEAAILERKSKSAIRYRTLMHEEVRSSVRV
jgi:proteasome alpha subunit